MKLLATDYDGTLKFGSNVMPEDLASIQEWKDRGNLFVIVTGRSYESIKGQIDEYKIPADYVVTNNGGMVFDRDGNILSHNMLDVVTAIDLMYAAHSQPEVVSYVVNDGVHRYKVNINDHLFDHRYSHLKQELPEEKIMDMGNFAQIVFSCRDASAAVHLAENINNYFGNIVAAYANNYVVDVVPHGISKDSGLEFVASYNNLDDEDVYCIGDSYNDEPMLASYDNSAAMMVAPEQVKESAGRVVESVSEYIHSID